MDRRETGSISTFEHLVRDLAPGLELLTRSARAEMELRLPTLTVLTEEQQREAQGQPQHPMSVVAFRDDCLVSRDGDEEKVVALVRKGIDHCVRCLGEFGHPQRGWWRSPPSLQAVDDFEAAGERVGFSYRLVVWDNAPPTVTCSLPPPVTTFLGT